MVVSRCINRIRVTTALWVSPSQVFRQTVQLCRLCWSAPDPGAQRSPQKHRQLLEHLLHAEPSQVQRWQEVQHLLGAGQWSVQPHTKRRVRNLTIIYDYLWFEMHTCAVPLWSLTWWIVFLTSILSSCLTHLTLSNCMINLLCIICFCVIFLRRKSFYIILSFIQLTEFHYRRADLTVLVWFTVDDVMSSTEMYVFRWERSLQQGKGLKQLRDKRRALQPSRFILTICVPL